MWRWYRIRRRLLSLFESFGNLGQFNKIASEKDLTISSGCKLSMMIPWERKGFHFIAVGGDAESITSASATGKSGDKKGTQDSIYDMACVQRYIARYEPRSSCVKKCREMFLTKVSKIPTGVLLVFPTPQNIVGLWSFPHTLQCDPFIWKHCNY